MESRHHGRPGRRVVCTPCLWRASFRVAAEDLEVTLSCFMNIPQCVINGAEADLTQSGDNEWKHQRVL